MTLFDRYDLRSDIGTEGCLGMGGFGSVWAYWDNKELRTVAIKVLPEIIYESQWDDLQQKFDNLKTRIGEEQGQGIVRIYDLKRDGNRPYMIMEYIDGKNLEEIRHSWPKKRFEWSYIKPILLQIATALDHVHAIDIVHCDVKPANIMLDSEGTHAKLLDFDISQEIQNSIYRTRTKTHKEEGGAIVGSYPYMAPEQWYSNPSKYSDQYSLACIVFECLEGEAAFSCPRNEFNTFEFWQALHAQDFEKKAERLGPRANAVLRKALAKVQTQRYESCVEFIMAFDEAFAYDLEHGNGPEETTPPSHDVRNILIFLGIIAVIGFVVYRIMFPPILQPWQEIEKQWTKILPELEQTQWPVKPVVENMKLLLMNCKKYQDKPALLKEFQREAEELLGHIKSVLNCHKENQQLLKNAKEQLRAEENCPEEWDRANELIGEAEEAVKTAMKTEDNDMAATYYAMAIAKWDESKQTFGELENQCKILKDKNDRIIEELKVARQFFEQLDIKDFISNEWEAFLTEYDSKANLEKSFESLRKRDYYKRSMEICEYLVGKLGLMKFNAAPQIKSFLESADKDAHTAQTIARENLAQLEFPDEMNNLDERMAKQDDEMKKWNQQFQGLQPSDAQSKSIDELLTNYKAIKNAYDEIKQGYEDIARKTTEQRKALDLAYASLKKTYNDLFNDNEIRTVVNSKELDALQRRLAEIDESKNKRNAAGLIVDIQKLNSDCIELQKKGNSNKELLRQAEKSHHDWMENKALLEKFQEQWSPETEALIREGKQAEENYKELCRDFEFEKARKLADEWLRKFDDAAKKLSGVIQKKAGELKAEVAKMIEELKAVVQPGDDHADIENNNKSYEKGLEALENEDYLQAYKLFANIKEKLPILIYQLKTAHYARDCEALKTKKDWSGLGKCASEWLQFDPNSLEAKDFQKMSHDMITQQHRDKCVECWNKKDAISLKICADQWLEFDPDSKEAKDFQDKAEEITVTIQQFNETCEKYQKQKDVDSLRRSVEQWLEYDPASHDAQVFLAKADEIEETIQKFRKDCMDCQKRKDADKLEETAKKWLVYKSDSQEAQDFQKEAAEIRVTKQKFKDTCTEFENKKDVDSLRKIVAQWLEYDPDSRDAQDFQAKADEIEKTVQQFRGDCVDCQNRKDARKLEETAKQWLEYDSNSQEAKDFLKASRDMTIQQFREKCVECWNKKDAISLKICAEQWLKFDPDSQEAQDFLKKSDEIKVTVKEFQDTCAKYEALKDVDSLKKSVEQWLKYDPDSQEAKDFLAKADEIEKTIQQFKDACMDCQNRKDAAALEETAKKWLEYKPDSQEASDFLKKSRDMTIQQFREKCMACEKQNDAVSLKKNADDWLTFDPESQEAKKYLKTSHDMTIKAYKNQCTAYKNQEEWGKLNDCAEQWLQFEKDNQEAAQFRDLAQKELKNQQYVIDFKEANRKGNIEDMENMLRGWRQVASEKPMFKKADTLYKALQKLDNSVKARNWKETFALSLGILQGDDYTELGKDCGFARNTLDTSIMEILKGAENAAKQSAEHPYREQFDAWNRLESEAGDILKKLPENPEAVKYRESAQNGKRALRQRVVDDFRTVLKDDKTYASLHEDIEKKLSFIKNCYKEDDTYRELQDVKIKCEALQDSLNRLIKKKEEDITDNLIDDVNQKADDILKSQACAFADECKRIARSKQRKRIVKLPNGSELVLLPVKAANGSVLFWMGECEISQEQYESLLDSDAPSKLLKNLPYNSWFKVSSKKMKTFIKDMRIPTNEPNDGNLPIRSVTWDEAFAWCEMLNVHIGQNRGQFKERDNVLRLPTVGEWEMACGSVDKLTNDALHRIRTTAPNKQGFYDMLGNVSEWTIDAMVSGKYLYAPPQGFSQQSNNARLPRIHIGRSWQQNAERSESYIFTAKADFIVAGKGQGAETKEKKVKTISGDRSSEVGFRVIWAKPLPSK